MKYYSKITILPKKNLADMKNFELDNTSLNDVVRYFCINYRKNAEKEKGQNQYDYSVSSLFPEAIK